VSPARTDVDGPRPTTNSGTRTRTPTQPNFERDNAGSSDSNVTMTRNLKKRDVLGPWGKMSRCHGVAYTRTPPPRERPPPDEHPRARASPPGRHRHSQRPGAQQGRAQFARPQPGRSGTKPDSMTTWWKSCAALQIAKRRQPGAHPGARAHVRPVRVGWKHKHARICSPTGLPPT
jgi:hypothetical protein